MNKILRYSFVALLAMVGWSNALAQDVIWSEDFSSYKADDVPSGGTYSYVCTDNGTNLTKIYDEALAGGEKPELLIGKKNNNATNPTVLGTFAATVNLGGKSGDMTLSFKSNKNLAITVDGGTIGDNTGTGNDYVYPITGASGTLKITFTNNITTNARLDNIKLFQGQSKKPAGLSWGTSTRTVTIGADDNVFPTLTNENNLTVTYSSSETSVATIAADGTITLVAAGQTVITAESAETAEFEAGKAQYTLTVKEAAVEIEQITVARALEIANGLASGGYSDVEYKVKGFVVGTPKIDKDKNGNFYGNATFYMADTKGGTTQIYAFQIYGLNGEKMNSETYLKDNDEVIVQGKLQKYVKNDDVTLEIAKGGKLVELNGETSHVSALKADIQNAPAYNVGGQRVNQGYKGLVIKGGKKLIQK